MVRRPSAKHVLYLDGVRFAPGQLFSTQERTERLYSLLFGAGYIEGVADKDAHSRLRARATRTLSDIFRLCLKRVATFVALNNWNLGLQIVVGDIKELCNCIMDPAEVDELIRVFADARPRFLEHPHNPHASPASVLTTLMYDWLDKTRRGQTSSEPATTALVACPAPIENLFAGCGLRDGGQSASPASTTNTSWPPSHLPASDTEFLKYPWVQAKLASVTWRDQGQIPPVPGEKTDPLGLRVWLGWLAAAHTPPPPNNTLALYAAPVAFFTNKERQDWYEPSGCQSKLFGHVDGFLEYAAEAFKSGKAIVVGLVTPFFPTIDEAKAYANTSGKPALEVSKNHANMRRFGTALTMRAVERDGVQGLKVALFCPWDQHQYIKNSWKFYDWRLRLWKEKIVTAVEGWATKHNATIYDGYLGGSIIVRKDRDYDSVEMCAGWLLRVVTAMKKTIPGDKEEHDWEWVEFCFFKKLPNWVRAEEDEDKDGQMEIDTDM